MELTSIINSNQLPPWLTKEITSYGCSAANDILLCVLKRAKKEVKDLAMEDGTSPDEAINSIDEVDVLYSNILHQLFVWSTTNKAIAGCTSIATSEEAAEINEQLHEAIAPQTYKRNPTDSPDGHTSHLQCSHHSLFGLAANLQVNIQANIQANLQANLATNHNNSGSFAPTHTRTH